MSLTPEDFPTELVEPINALNDKKRRRIILTLLEKDCFSYSEMKNILKIKKGTLNHHLNVLIGSGLVQNFNTKSPRSSYSSYYKISHFGREFLSGIRQTLEPSKQMIIATSSATTTTVEAKTGYEPFEASASAVEEEHSQLLSPLRITPKR